VNRLPHCKLPKTPRAMSIRDNKVAVADWDNKCFQLFEFSR